MLSKEIIGKIKNLKEIGRSNAEISHLLKISYPTVLKYLRKNYNKTEKIEQKTSDSSLLVPSSIEGFTDEINEYIKSEVTSSKKIEIELRNKGYKGSYQSLNKYIKNLKESNIIKKTSSYFRIETEPGEQAQVDWGSFGTIVINGIKLNLYAFVYVLSYSRAIYAEFVTNQKQKTLQGCHIHAFKYLGGVPKKIRYDNMKTVVIGRKKDIEGEFINWNFEFKNFAKYYQFEPELCPRYYPRSKGKVEAGVKFLRNNFFQGETFNKTFYGVDDLNSKLQKWIEEYANKRKHPILENSVTDAWEKEKPMLRSSSDFEDLINNIPQISRVSGISMVSYKKASYWVPKEYVHYKVEVREVAKNGLNIVEFHTKEGKIAEYTLASPGSWILPDDRELIKNNSKKNEVIKRVKENPLYSLKIETRDLGYYQKVIDMG